ncbi:hypothetical protein F5Y13DRAFT_189369 [Hypoxylon sp. FL1857]|nr:hypothetical protein F5Y13DRAFT_189369 [Hypoxylon sp. FL1857]
MAIITSDISIKQSTFGKLTSLRYFFYSTQFLRSEVPISAWSLILLGSREQSIDDATFLDVQGGIWDIFRCCHSVYDDYGIGWLGMESFWLVVWRCLELMRRTDTGDPYAHKYLPHIEEAGSYKYVMQRTIDAWNRRTHLQTYWDPRTGSQAHGRRLGSIPNDTPFHMAMTLERVSRPQRKFKLSRKNTTTSPRSPRRAPSSEDDDSLRVNEDLGSAFTSDLSSVPDDSDVDHE